MSAEPWFIADLTAASSMIDWVRVPSAERTTVWSEPYSANIKSWVFDIVSDILIWASIPTILGTSAIDDGFPEKKPASEKSAWPLKQSNSTSPASFMAASEAALSSAFTPSKAPIILAATETLLVVE